MVKINRRQFIYNSFAGAAAISAGLANLSYSAVPDTVDKVKLGSSGLLVPRIAMGTGTRGSRGQTNQTRLGMPQFIKLARHAYDRGLKFFDSADTYGSHTFVRGILNEVPREETILLSKIWTRGDGGGDAEPVNEILDRFRIETGTDYFDIILLHFMTNGQWPEEKKRYMDDLLKAKQQGIIKKVGVSCHNIDALRVAAEEPWVDILLARINPYNVNMDATPEVVMPILETARKNGKGVIGMKIFGEGKLISDDEREKSLRYSFGCGNIHCVTLGLESNEEVDDAVGRVMSMV